MYFRLPFQRVTGRAESQCKDLRAPTRATSECCALSSSLLPAARKSQGISIAIRPFFRGYIFREEFESTQMVISKVALLRSNAPTVARPRLTGQRSMLRRGRWKASRYLLTILHGALYKSSAQSGQM
jgi:hypothetical protein